MRRLEKEIVSKDKLAFIEAQLKLLPSKRPFKKIKSILLSKAMKGCEKSKRLIKISNRHSMQVMG